MTLMPDKIRKGIGIVATTLQNITSRVKKATGLGVIEFMLRFMLWLCLRNDDNRGNQMCIVPGGGTMEIAGLPKPPVINTTKVFEDNVKPIGCEC
jgi:hypothetical protein